MRKFLFLTMFFAVGCATSSPRQPSSFFGNYKGPMEVSPVGFNRPSKIFLPKNYDEKDKWPLILMLHGYTSNASQADTLLGLSKRVTSRGFLLLTPEGTELPYTDEAHGWKKGDKFWNATDFCCDLEKTNVDDVGYLLALIKEASARYHVDEERIYLFGHSNGGFMTNRLLCETDRFFAGAITLAGSTYKDPKMCRLKNPVSYLQVHAEDDPTVAYGENQFHAGGLGTVEQRVSAAGCKGAGVKGPEEELVFSISGLDTTPTTWSNCEERTEVILWTLRPYESRWHAPHHPWFRDAAGEKAIDFLMRHTRAKKKTSK
jgi:polyhydroxybutyrate depolymerase